jgi:D123
MPLPIQKKIKPESVNGRSKKKKLLREMSANESVDPFTLNRFSAQHWEYMAQYDFERWYPAVKGYTFETRLRTLQKSEARALVAKYRQAILSRENESQDDNEKILAKLRDDINDVIVEAGWNTDARGTFCRLSSRSPKDVTLDSVGQMFRRNSKRWKCALETLEPEIDASERVTWQSGNSARQLESGENAWGAHDAWANRCLRATMRLANEELRVVSGAQVLDMLAASERIYSDLLRALEADEWRVEIVLRRFDVNVDPELEFRCFAVRNDDGVFAMNCCTQYNDTLYYPYFSKETLEPMVGAMVACFDKSIAPALAKLGYASAIVDFAVVAGSCDVWLVEINPFGPMTGAGLFDYRADRALVTSPPSTSEPASAPDADSGVAQKCLHNVIVRYRTAPMPRISEQWNMFGESSCSLQ